jgi:hypothetical protein
MRFWLAGPRILGIRPGISFRQEELLQKAPSPIHPSRGGFVYIISGAHGHLKIGSSENPNRRLAELKTGSPFALAITYAGALRCDGHAIEVAAHETLARYRLEGEWFNCPVDMAVAAIGAAAHRLGEPIASVAPNMISKIVSEVARQNQIEAATDASLSQRFMSWYTRFLIRFLIFALYFAVGLFLFITGIVVLIAVGAIK